MLTLENSYTRVIDKEPKELMLKFNDDVGFINHNAARRYGLEIDASIEEIAMAYSEPCDMSGSHA